MANILLRPTLSRTVFAAFSATLRNTLFMVLRLGIHRWCHALSASELAAPIPIAGAIA
jgi:hypothetical protein